MGALSDLLRAATLATLATQPGHRAGESQESQGGQAPPTAFVELPSVATIATPATRTLAPVVVSQESQESQRTQPDMRARLLALATDECLPAALVHRLSLADVDACHGMPDAVLRAYLRALERGRHMDAGRRVPEGYTRPVQCDGCGPVWLWPGCPPTVRACPWCWRRTAGQPVPRPTVRCGDCCHFIPDPLNPKAGMGCCGLRPEDATRWQWPMRAHVCADMKPS